MSGDFYIPGRCLTQLIFDSYTLFKATKGFPALELPTMSSAGSLRHQKLLAEASM